ncbi:hypothetical protein SLEP1_g52003 [Rubroshorea leprosula]|uniref:Embryonic flower 1 n=1 Tax=Rubroshorea leprosula TaxID=152421 RepID=A0AAV5M513_9ROSI|nr:hypothetical protein SLEP1_g52003 [Rubroshorea leprosula]
MERTVSVEENYESCSANLVSMLAGSSIKIDSIVIDLVNANNGVDAEKCKHNFSIRGYVSEVRSKDWKKCWPFALDSGHDNPEEQNCKLPPLDVPEFRWWSCQNCLRKVGAKGIANEDGALVNTNGNLKSFASCCHSDATMLLSDLQQAADLKIHESSNADASTSLNGNCNGYHHSLCGDKGEKKAKIANSLMIGHATGSRDTMKEIPNVLNCAVIEDIPSLMQQRCQTNLAFRSKWNGSLENRKHDLKYQQVIDFTHVNLNHMVKNNADMLNRVSDSIKNCTSNHPFLELDECDYLSSESAEILLGTASGNSHRRKTRKVRLLTELLGKNGDERTNIIRTESPPTNDTPDAFAGENSFSVPQGQATIQGNGAGSFGQNRKRKLPEDEEWRSVEQNSPNNAGKKIRGFNKSAEIVDAVVSSDLEGALAGAGLETGLRSHLINLKIDEHPIMGKKKNKKAQISDECLSLTSSRVDVQKETLKKTGDPSKSNATDVVLFNFGDTAFTGEGVNILPPVEKTEKQTSFSKRKNMMHQDCDGPGFSIPENNSMLRESLTSRQGVETRNSGSISLPLMSAGDSSTEKGLHLSFRNCFSPQRGDGKYFSSIMDRPASLPPWKGAIFREDEIMRKDLKMNHMRDSAFPSKSELDSCLMQGAHVDLNSKRTSYRTSFPNEKLKMHTSQAEFGSCSLLQQMHFCGTSNNMKTMGNQENLFVTRKHVNQRAEMVSDQGTLDDITMEIVELMAKNQYERCLPDAKTEKQSSIATNNARNHQKLDLNKAYRSGGVSLLPGESAHKSNPCTSNGRIGKTTKGDNVGSSKQKSADYFPEVDGNQYNMSQLEQSCAPTGFRLFARSGENPSNGLQFSDTSSSRHGSAQNCQWIGNMVGNRPSHSTMQALVACNACQGAPQQKAAHLLSSLMPNNLAFLCTIPQKCADESTNSDGHSCCPSNLPRGNMNGGNDRNFLNLSTSNLERYNRKFDSETLRSTPSDYPFPCKHHGVGTLDLYSNETIPAMHLLSLMDAGFQSGAPVDLNGNQKFLRRDSFLHNHHFEEFPDMASSGCRTSNATKHLASDCYGKNHQLADFHEHLAAIPTAGASTSFQHDRTFKKDSAFPVQLSLKSRDKEKTKHSDSQIQNRNRRSQKTTSSSGGLSTTCGSIPVHSMPKLILGTANLMFPPQFPAMDNATRYKLEAQAVSRDVSGAVLPSKASSKTEICSLNRNPADFTVPEPGNVYMIRGEDLKFRRPSAFGNRSGLLKLGGHKRQKKVCCH